MFCGSKLGPSCLVIKSFILTSVSVYAGLILPGAAVIVNLHLTLFWRLFKAEELI